MIGTGCTLGRAPRTKETLPDFHEWCRVTRHPRIFRGLTDCQRTPGKWGVTEKIIRLDHEWNVHFHHRIEIFLGYMWLVGFQLLNASLVMMV